MSYATEGPEWAWFLARVNELCDLDGIFGLLSWDEETYAPAMARGPRGRQLATLEAIRHQRLVDPLLGERIDRLGADLTPGSEPAILVARVRRKRDLAVKVPEALVKALVAARSRALAAWEAAREASDYGLFAPALAEVLELTRERARALNAAAPYDALLDDHEPGMSCALLDPILGELRDGLVPLLGAIAEAGQSPDRSLLSRGPFADADQWRFTLRLLEDLGFDFSRGRQDRSTHPFTLYVSEHDVRLTTRIDEENPFDAIFSSIHEAGHALYDQGFRTEHWGTHLAEAPSAGLHESQARLWENQVARSLPFWEHYAPVAAEHFSGLRGLDADALFRFVNAVEPGFIRVDADEVTYNLHILLRYELEVALVDGQLTPADLPGAWAEKMHRYLGIVPPDDRQGVLQDIHWALGALGYFPSYAIGNLWAAQLMAAVEQADPELWGRIRRGEFATLLGWLRERVHQVGHLKAASDIVRDATGQPIAVQPFLAYVRRKYGQLYRLDLGA